jgi:hypothetical protein
MKEDGRANPQATLTSFEQPLDTLEDLNQESVEQMERTSRELALVLHLHRLYRGV